MSDQFATKRPLGVTIVAALAIVSGIVDVSAGIMLLTLQSDPEIADRLGGPALIVAAAIVSILLGAATILISWALLRRNPTARIAMTVLQVLSLIGSLWLCFANPAMLPSEIFSALVAAALLFLLWSGEASRYFAGLAPDEPTA